jgi:hypothetical protein
MSKRFLSPMEDNHDGAFTVDGFCRKYGIGRTAFYEEVTAGRLKAKKRGTRTMIERAEARRWFANLPSFARTKKEVGSEPTRSTGRRCAP